MGSKGDDTQKGSAKCPNTGRKLWRKADKKNKKHLFLKSTEWLGIAFYTF